MAAKRFFRKLLKGLRMVPCAIVTDRLASYRTVMCRRWREWNIVSETTTFAVAA
jgi:transposase-like protein